MYAEQVEVLPDGTRDAYYTRVNEISLVEGQPVTRIYKRIGGIDHVFDAWGRRGSPGLAARCLAVGSCGSLRYCGHDRRSWMKTSGHAATTSCCYATSRSS